jgi:integrase
VPDTRSAAEKRKVSDRRLHLTPEEAHRLIAAAGKRGRYPERDRVIVRLIYRHGLRAAEACNLRWDHLNLDDGTIAVRRRKMGKDSTHSMDRDELRDLRKIRRETNSPYVFTTERGGPLSVRALQYIVAEAGKAAGLPEELVHPHALRHAAGFFLINAEVDVRLVQEFLGHRTPAMTMHYTAVSPKRLAAVRVR